MPPAEPGTGAPDLLASLCHDLREPLASIVMGAGFLRRSLGPDDDASRRVAEAIHRAADRMGQLIGSFSDLAGLQLNQIVLDARAHDLGELVRTAFERLVAEAASHDVQVSLDLEPGLGLISCDRTRVLQILRHLGQAALRVVPDGGHIVFGAGPDEVHSPRVRVIVKRSSSRAIGMQPPKPAMTIARGLVELHGGSLTVGGNEDSLTMSFTLPWPVDDGVEAGASVRAPGD